MPLEYSDRFKKQYVRLTPQIQKKVDKAMRLLDADFRHPGLRSHSIEGAHGIFEAYVDDKYRLTFERRSDVLVMRNVDNHDECLREP